MENFELEKCLSTLITINEEIQREEEKARTAEERKMKTYRTLIIEAELRWWDISRFYDCPDYYIWKLPHDTSKKKDPKPEQ
jgi:hypothetical protein